MPSPARAAHVEASCAQPRPAQSIFARRHVRRRIPAQATRLMRSQIGQRPRATPSCSRKSNGVGRGDNTPHRRSRRMEDRSTSSHRGRFDAHPPARPAHPESTYLRRTITQQARRRSWSARPTALSKMSRILKASYHRHRAGRAGQTGVGKMLRAPCIRAAERRHGPAHADHPRIRVFRRRKTAFSWRADQRLGVPARADGGRSELPIGRASERPRVLTRNPERLGRTTSAARSDRPVAVTGRRPSPAPSGASPPGADLHRLKRVIR